MFTLLTSLAEMKRFELLRRFEPTYRIRVCPEFPNLAEFDGSWGKLWEPKKARVSAGFEKTEKKKERRFLGREVPVGRGKF